MTLYKAQISQANACRLLFKSLLLTPVFVPSLLLCQQANAAPERSPFSLTVARTSTATADVGANTGNELQRDAWKTSFSATMPLNRQWSIGANVGYDNLDYDWRINQATQLQSAEQDWSTVHQYSAGLSLTYRLDNHWMFLIAPQLKYAYADTASSSNAQSYGVVASSMYRFDSGNMLGFGVAYLNDISEVRTVPYIAVRWQINDKLVLANPFQAGFSGPAGLELSYQYRPDIDFGIGSSKRTERFLVADDDQTIEIDEWVGFVRAGWKATDSLSLNAYAGYYFGGEMELSDPKVTEDIEDQAAFGLVFKLAF
ncbi:autotransporter outer membrane beta-barrel domain-containing protein [Shewanella phaeophyticola]|uniref:Autotransporter outer membrane beta-barrel domain-containing protein n=1 Tax=Shewanella phaeophyticola TaxID=2978345 RepID=A0ABT2P5T6_9GAMM|nr:autotransporter outer membrane beta-barrel domain-containing protein [Shewanella sp. KJ10-1]MCT8987259.1 autotransporter outer membrane beta-barrel domain-containing protein [Shewanella sp. KJ10-1]